MSGDIEELIAQLEAVLQSLDTLGHDLAAIHTNQAIEELKRVLLKQRGKSAALPTDESVKH